MEKPLSCSKSSINIEPVALSHQSDTDEIFSINCLLRTVRVEGAVCLLARVNYCFPSDIESSVAAAVRHADCLNELLHRSNVHVVKDIDGDRGHFLQMDSVLRGDLNQDSISAFLSDVAKDIAVMLKYFQKEADRPQADSLSAISKRCNVASLQTHVRMVA